MANDPQMKTKVNYSIIQQNGKFVVAKNGQPIQLPSSMGQSIVTEFNSREDAEKYMGILKNLSKR